MASSPDISVMTMLIQLLQLAAHLRSQDPMMLDPSERATPTLDCDDVEFYLANKEDPNGGLKACLNQKTALFNGKLDPSKRTKVLVHGWMNSRKTDFPVSITRSYLKVSDVNVILVDWSAIAMKDYFTARSRVPEVGYTVAAFIKRITQELKVKFSSIHMIGHSLGAQTVGIAGNQFQPPNKTARVTGLDPAGPLFLLSDNSEMISKDSGEFVVILHTCAGLLGTTKQLGHVDFYANGGTPIQPGCEPDILGVCSHLRAISYYAESVEDPKAFEATRCNSYGFYKTGLCKGNELVYLGDDVNRNASGKYYFNTTTSYPFKLN